jgi:hypothetical protein
MGPASYFGKFLENASTGDRHSVDTATDQSQDDDDVRFKCVGKETHIDKV